MKGMHALAAAIAVVGFTWGCGGSQTAPEPAKAPDPAKAPAAEAKPAPGAPAPAAAPAPAGMIVIEAENPKANVKAGGVAWVPVTKPAGFSGTGAMQAMPNDGVNNDADYVKDSPRLDYEVDFPKAGTWRVWVRGCGESQDDNSCHVGLDGKECETADRVAEFEEDWTWCNDTKDGDPAEIKVAAPGKHILNVWMREDGFVIDKIILTQDTKFVPTGK